MADKFCPYCGKEKVFEWNGRYSAQNGEKVFVGRCVDSCQHGFHDWGPLVYPTGIRALYENPTETCRRCGKKEYAGSF